MQALLLRAGAISKLPCGRSCGSGLENFIQVDGKQQCPNASPAKEKVHCNSPAPVRPLLDVEYDFGFHRLLPLMRLLALTGDQRLPLSQRSNWLVILFTMSGQIVCRNR